ncbi:MAG: threonine synthase [Thaumarchaeota archaeon]|nr:threonine synthase [Candidatus Calditenuaceae archaeon]MDW8187642.1 threonine synthase [Nitrososphaerota archaeon]
MSLSFLRELVCSKCGRRYLPAERPLICRSRDLGRLDVVYDYEELKEFLSRDALSRRPWAGGVWRYWELLPAARELGAPLNEGLTPLICARRLNEHVGLRRMWLKDETRNPTGSFKDRSMAVGVAKAVEMRMETVVTASSGNAASSLAAYAASLGLKCYAFVPEEVSIGKAAQLLTYGAKLFRVKAVEEGRDPTVQLMLKAVEAFGWYPCPSFGPFNPYQVEGPKTVVYEVAENLGWRFPDAILVPTGSACFLAGIWKGVRDLVELGLVGDDLPKLIAVQPEGNQPLVRAVRGGLSLGEVEPERSPRSIASGLLDPYPWDGDAAIEGIRRTGGTGVSVSDAEILDAVRLLANRAGVFAEPSGAVGLAAAMRLRDEGFFDESDELVTVVTGSGLKEVERLVSTVGEIPLITPDLEQLRVYVES